MLLPWAIEGMLAARIGLFGRDAAIGVALNDIDDVLPEELGANPPLEPGAPTFARSPLGAGDLGRRDSISVQG